jgi:hypothetical protein
VSVPNTGAAAGPSGGSLALLTSGLSLVLVGGLLSVRRRRV